MLTVEEARTLVGLKATDNSRDTRLQQLIDAAYEQAVRNVGPLQQTTVTETVPVYDGTLILNHPPVTGIVSVTGVSDLTTLTSTSRTGVVTGLAQSCRGTEVTVTYLSGFATVPASVEEGVRAWVRHRFLQESYGTDTYGGDAVSGAVTDFDGLPNAVRNAWEPYLLMREGLG